MLLALSLIFSYVILALCGCLVGISFPISLLSFSLCILRCLSLSLKINISFFLVQLYIYRKMTKVVQSSHILCTQFPIINILR